MADLLFIISLALAVLAALSLGTAIILIIHNTRHGDSNE